MDTTRCPKKFNGLQATTQGGPVVIPGLILCDVQEVSMLFLGGGSHGQYISTSGQNVFRTVKPQKERVQALSDAVPECAHLETEIYLKEIIVVGGRDRFVYRHESTTCDEMLELWKRLVK